MLRVTVFCEAKVAENFNLCLGRCFEVANMLSCMFEKKRPVTDLNEATWSLTLYAKPYYSHVTLGLL